MIFGRIGGVMAAAFVVFASLPSCTSTANVTDVFTSLDGDGGRRRNVFFTDTKQIYCLAEVGIGRDDVTLEILVRQLQEYDFDGDRYKDVNAVVASSEVRPQRTGTTPRLFGVELIPAGPDGKANPDLPMPAGRAQCEVYLDGQLEGTAIFNTDFPACPQTRIQPGSGCYGFYKPRQICPLSGATGDPQPTCTCEAGGWQC